MVIIIVAYTNTTNEQKKRIKRAATIMIIVTVSYGNLQGASDKREGDGEGRHDRCKHERKQGVLATTEFMTAVGVSCHFLIRGS